jgi:hypothetical protein
VQDAERTSQFVEFDLDVNFWTKWIPDVPAARPPRCPRCRAPGVRSDGRVLLHGHGLRRRRLRGPAWIGGEALEREVLVRRYACKCCRAVITVGPRGLLSGRRYTAMAVALALWRWAVCQLTDPQVRAALCSVADEGLSRPERWTTLRRWARAARDGRLWSGLAMAASWTLRQTAERVARWVWARGDPRATTDEGRVFDAAAHAR